MTEPETGQLARLAALEAKFAILEHTVSYNEAWDDGRLDDWVATWTGNGVFVLPGAPDTVGAAALRVMVSAMQDAGFVHLTLNQRITVEGEIAHQDCYVILATRSPSRRPGTSQWVTSGRYRDELVREDCGWKFARREFAPDASIRSLPKWW